MSLANELTETAPAKINLALHVRGRMPDAYHRLETIFAFAQEGDRLSVEPDAALSLRIEGPFAAGLDAGPGNLVLRAAEALRQAAGVSAGAALRLAKNLPVAAGIGGGSADAAAALRLLARLWGTEVPLEPIARSLGADVPACLAGHTVRGEGRGDVLTPVDPGRLSGTPLLLVNPGAAMPTGPVFAAWDGMDRGALAQGEPLAAALAGRNDLEEPAIRLCPAIGELLAWLRARPGVLLARMSGSGATCFALFERDEDLARAEAAARRDWPWCLATILA
ncbi:4-(cytidine 5'-diphospho)-2-C-methyl-D-erythritol kinase [Sphingomonas sp. MAH-20]|uniref:4-diphosphocytidyl-2-C-methyl-D-erythritol kinase n=1 Tax=Sphingomonas horti TaxID=2682842 RepID=A0A6I4IWH6_9SPHN|nr:MULTISPECIES: 4-(cytidine 5'-diphospho)-2-C-methyl-D-erythritol kinase [Sphingomonas]MBA2920251.1 4-(cytidine 5'-diphospho)-2-C-methyl-D-erythritol kinase [Sphingomonas sp. CGMCC 1.13658]MVO76505.1 4-(cytidine 5'-diphospho)-2-C-methyl-D-erythritol kinase [Sphingomonas horti]